MGTVDPVNRAGRRQSLRENARWCGGCRQVMTGTALAEFDVEEL
jgi:hypothetical protein